MLKSRFTEEQIVGIPQEYAARAKASEPCRKHGMSEGTFYNWKATFGGLTVSKAKQPKALKTVSAEGGLQRNDLERVLSNYQFTEKAL